MNNRAIINPFIMPGTSRDIVDPPKLPWHDDVASYILESHFGSDNDLGYDPMTGHLLSN